MNTPICDFVKKYNEDFSVRMHMPGHKGVDLMGFEHLDITEFDGADDLYHPSGIIAESEKNAARIFGCPTFYSTEGASQCIRAMLHLIILHAKKTNKKLLIAAGRNAHKAFISAAVMLDFDIAWLYPEEDEAYLSCNIAPEKLDAFFCTQKEKPVALYLTSPDYLGKISDIKAISKICHKHGVLLAVDNAHGAYLKFLEKSLHPMDLGADICCDSAHKTLPVVTGGAYLHIAENTPFSMEEVKSALALYGSTSPSYLILQSLDACNAYLEGYKNKLADFLYILQKAKARLEEKGYTFYGNEPMKLTICANEYGYTGTGFADILARNNIFCEFYDPNYLVLMPTPETKPDDLEKLVAVLNNIPQKEKINLTAPKFTYAEKVLSAREAALSPSEALPVELCENRILASVNVGCPPAVPILVCGEKISKDIIPCFMHYGITKCNVIKE